MYNYLLCNAGYQEKLISDAGGNFISETFEKICKKLDIECVTLSYHHKSNGQVEKCIKRVKISMKKCCDTKSDIYLALLQVRMMLLGLGLPSPETLLFNCPTRGIMQIVNRALISMDNDEEHHKALIKGQTKMIKI